MYSKRTGMRTITQAIEIQKLLDPKAPSYLFYTDDGEYQDCAVFPAIDYRRDSEASILRSLKLRKENSFKNVQ